MYTTSGDQMLQYPPSQIMMDQSRWKPHVEIAPNCPRCASPNTKFCYYNNYSLSQPRYFCKGCKRYWTKGGSLRNVPVGGGCRKNRRSRPARLALSQANRVGLGYLRDLPSPTRSSSGSVNMSPGGSDGPAEIDLADVFAKFLTNQNSEEKQFGDQDSSSGTSCGSLEMPLGIFDVDTHQMDNFMMECQIPSDLIQEACLSNELPGDFVGEEGIQEFVCHYPNLNELQELLNDEELPQDISWKDDHNLSSFSWQQEFGQVSYNGQLQMATNLAADDWSSMNLSSYGIFSRP